MNCYTHHSPELVGSGLQPDLFVFELLLDSQQLEDSETFGPVPSNGVNVVLIMRRGYAARNIN